nr:immunoglobulin heavy chain junction region [Macaca mulatta]MOY19422.1 immunoglobulin heavy chain junction region [Macaca mulatta]
CATERGYSFPISYGLDSW